MTTRLASCLQLRPNRVQTTICGFGDVKTQSRSSVTCTIRSQYGVYSRVIDCVVVDRITPDLPTKDLPPEVIKLLPSVNLADHTFHKRGKVDMLLGAEFFYELMFIGQMRVNNGTITLQETAFGWIVSGTMSSIDTRQAVKTFTTTSENTDELLQRFWKVEEPTSCKTWTPDEITCESIFLATVKRNILGRYEVGLPLRKIVHQLGDSKQRAIQRFLSLERRLTNNLKLKTEYTAFINEYIQLGHMLKDNTGDDNFQKYPSFFLPHHAVFKNDSSTTKLRVVFDGSAKSDTGISLNDALIAGPVIQEDLFSIIIRFRCHNIVMTADIEKMYRQIQILPEFTTLQKIIWRNDPKDNIGTYTLKTVTYGTSAAPYLATRVLQQLAQDEYKNYPQASTVVKRDFYVDDLLTGTTDSGTAIKLRDDLIQLCNLGGFTLRKWCSNSQEVVANLPEQLRGTCVDLISESTAKVLGVHWDPIADTIKYKCTPNSQKTGCTKRQVVSEMARLFDPLGLVSPVIIVAKVFVQTLWKSKLSWDESLSNEQHTTWTEYRTNLLKVNELHIPRCVHITDTVELHVFCDASERAYGACIYIQSTTGIHLLCAKSRVAPLKPTTIPRLELCAAVLGAELYKTVSNSLTLDIQNCTFWSDSTIVLSWLQPKHDKRWKQYVANRIILIHELTNNRVWRHVRSEDNPADLVSRGTTPKTLANSSLWWNGPSWLGLSTDRWPNDHPKECEIPEQIKERKTVQMLNTTVPINEIKHERYSSLLKLKRSTAWVLRFISNIKKPQPDRMLGPLTTSELATAMTALICQHQSQVFFNDITNITFNGYVKNSSRLKSLVPHLDINGILRVSGRLQQADVDEATRHPIILDGRSHFVHLIIKHEHERLLHAGAQQTSASLHANYWIIGLRAAVRQVVFKCIKCHRWKRATAHQLMGSLPTVRTQPAPTFFSTGVDYAGPLTVRVGTKRSKITEKAYVALFICLVTKAIHIELVTALTTDAFIASLRRFTARRGRPSKIYSDNGTNFVGASKVLESLFKQDTFKNAITSFMTNESIEWHFIPPHAPHFGGLWEAGVKSVKYHLRRVMGDTICNYEELNTVLNQIEAILNSRPLCPATNDINSFEVLTPAHFLIGRPLTLIPDDKHIEVKSLKTRWLMIQKIVTHFWARWRKEYLAILQNRPKWSNQQPNVEVGTLVLIHEDNLRPSQWKLGQIIDIHPGEDDRVRVVTVKTAQDVVRRPITKISCLPIDNIINKTSSTY